MKTTLAIILAAGIAYAGDSPLLWKGPLPTNALDARVGTNNVLASLVTTWDTNVPHFNNRFRTNGIITNIPERLYNATNVCLSEQGIRFLASSGQICKVYGHWWEFIPYVFAVYHPDGAPETRKCRLCGKTETKTEVWK